MGDKCIYCDGDGTVISDWMITCPFCDGAGVELRGHDDDDDDATPSEQQL